MNYLLEKKIKIFYLLAITALVAILLIFYINTRKVKSTGLLVEQTQEILRKSDNILVDVLNIETSFRGYILTGEEIFLEPYHNAIKTIDTNLDDLTVLLKSTPRLQPRLDSLKQATNERLGYTLHYIHVKDENQWKDAENKEILNRGKQLTDNIRKLLATINQEQTSLLAEQRADNVESYQYSDSVFLLLLFFSIVIFSLVVILVKNQTKRNNELEEFNASQKLLSNYSLSLIEASLDPLVTISAEGKITDMNQATINIIGMTREELTDTNFFDYFTEQQKAREVYQEIFANGSVADSPLTLKHKDGKLTDVLFNGSVYKDDCGSVLGVVVVARDITEQKRIAKELTEAIIFAEMATEIAENAKIYAENATITAENAVKAKQQFLSNMSHEIRTPMNAIIGFTKVVLKTDLTAKQNEYLTAIKMSGDALIVLINDILDLAKVDAGKMVFEKTPFRMALSISAMLHLFEPKIQEKNLELAIEYDNNIPNVLEGDPVRLHQIILNLVSNAVKFTNEGKITVSVRLISDDEDKVTIEFAIADTGIGIPESKMSTIFENFQQATSGTSRLYGGTGLGLAIVKQLVEPQGGILNVKSKVDEGSTFSFILSFNKTDQLAESENAIPDSDPEIKNIKVLVVEDIPLNQLLMKTLLDDFGFERDIADNGRIAIEMLQAKEFDIILMDLQMPEMNGFEATDYIRNSMNSKIPIIALTADVTTVDLAKCKAVGMNDYIAKPVDDRILYSKIVNLAKKPAVVDLKEVAKTIVRDSKKCIDLGYLVSRTKSNPKLMMEMISLYLEQTPTLISTMKQSMDEENWGLLYSAVHKMIPSFSIMGIDPDFENMAKQVQEFASTQLRVEEISDMVTKLDIVCTQACLELEEEYNILKNTSNNTTNE